ncbi:unnamed protein product [Didymodactylos carnosus]|uniref:Uncharacterized protein n=1 Tax=Didymodactylos carnosus TaxID=1234261 RepID=A0A815I316_9BILA|nr:unnamed protein product [Didymodactylos carnosus]CAF1359971.1 unnamed protein product [Didymodactylos carnosus]CAF3760225.1 unnamed protein product [Didymodactylos carnosus]CAF4237198.1 unnamed protein product [Didymodactylos carnosus]
MDICRSPLLKQNEAIFQFPSAAENVDIQGIVQWPFSIPRTGDRRQSTERIQTDIVANAMSKSIDVLNMAENQRRNSFMTADGMESTENLASSAPFNYASSSSLYRSTSRGNLGPISYPLVPLDLNNYPVNYDPHPEMVYRPNFDHITYKQDVAVRYLQPPTPPPPGPIVIREIRAPALPDAPPIVIKQRPPVALTPPPVIVRERPPEPPAIIPSRLVEKVIPPPPPAPRKVIIERMSALPPKPQPVIIEKWLPYKQQEQSRVIVQRAPALPPLPIQKNTIITWDAPSVDIIRNVQNLGTVRADPMVYYQQFGPTLTSSDYVLSQMSKYGVSYGYQTMYNNSARLMTAEGVDAFADHQASGQEILNGHYSSGYVSETDSDSDVFLDNNATSNAATVSYNFEHYYSQTDRRSRHSSTGEHHVIR